MSMREAVNQMNIFVVIIVYFFNTN
jgi:hypothetical protein